MTLAAGRVWRDVPGGFTALSGLGGERSDWLVAARVAADDGLSLAARALIDDDGHSAKHELRLAYDGGRFDIAGTLVHLAAEPAEDRPRRTTEWAMDSAVALTPNWTGLADWRYDLARGTPDRIGLGARFRNECLAVDVSLSRRFGASARVASRTEFGLTVDLIGFGDKPGGPARPCAR